MKKPIPVIAFFLTIASHIAAQSEVTANQVNGTWRYRQNEFKIWALGQQKLQVEFSGVWEHESAAGPTANTGEGAGIIRIEGNTASFKPDGAEDECKIVLKFTDRKLVVTQDGICGFGFNVTAAGTYKKVSSRKPKFDLED
ncbi:MAG TPA: hypothetical protein VKS98_07275 [Chthoniobacterales bacterium]|nr:hypothetical protein [Chthoniobacterales bacterium]